MPHRRGQDGLLLAAEFAGPNTDDTKARERIAELESQRINEQAEIKRLSTELATTKDDLQETANKLQTDQSGSAKGAPQRGVTCIHTQPPEGIAQTHIFCRS